MGKKKGKNKKRVAEASAEEVVQRTEKKCFKVGEVIFEWYPLVYVLLQQEKKFRCERCLYSRKVLIPCEKCLFVSYCSPRCKEIAWENSHKLECNKLKKLSEQTINDWCRLLGLLIMVLKRPAYIEPIEQILDLEVSFTSLDCREQILQDSSKRDFLGESYQFLVKYLGNLMVDFSEYRIIYIKVMSYTSNICSTEGCVIGCGIYVGLSAFQQSCRATACSTFAGPVVRVTCVKKIPFGSAKWVTLNRLKYFAAKEERKDFLKEFDYDCKCELCVDDTSDNETTALLDYPNAKKLDKFICRKLQAAYGMPETLEGLNERIRVYETAFNISSLIHGPYNTARLALLWNFTYALFIAGYFAKCRVVIIPLLAGYEFSFGKLSPTLANIMFLLVHTEMFLGNKTEAKTIMEKALLVSRLCYGQDHPFHVHMSSVYEHCVSENWNMGILIKTYPKYLYSF